MEDILCTQAMVDDEIDEPEEDVENNNVYVATLKILQCRKTGIPSMEFPIHIGENIIGRHTNCQISIPWSVSLSKKHAIIEAERDSCFLLDFGSSNKSRLGKLKLKPNVRYGLRDGDEIQFADVKCIFVQSNDDTTDDDILPIVEETPVKPVKKQVNINEMQSSSTPCSKLHIFAADTPENFAATSTRRYGNLEVSTIPDSPEVRDTPVTKPVKTFPSKSSPLICELPGTPCDEDNTGRVESETSNNTCAEADEQERRKCETDKIDYPMDSDTDIEENHGNGTDNRDKKDDEDVYSAATLPLETESENPCSSPILTSSGLVKNTSDEVIAESEEEDLDEMSLLQNLDPVQTQSFADIFSKETANPIANQQEINNKNQVEEKPISKLKDKSYGENEKASCSGLNSSSSTFTTAAYDTFDDMCTQAYTNDPMKSTNEAKRTECHDTLDVLETQEYFAVHQAEEDQTDIDGDQDVSPFDTDDSFNMATQDFCRSPEVSLAVDGTHLEVEETLPDILSEGTLYGTEYTDTEPMISHESATAAVDSEIKSTGTPVLLRSNDCTVPFAAYSSISKNENSNNIKRKSTMIKDYDFSTHSKISCEASNADPHECNGVTTRGKLAVESSDDTDDDTQIYSLSALRTQEKSSSQDSKISKDRASDALPTGNVKSKYVSDDTFPAQSSMESDTQSYSLTESVLNSDECRVITQQTVRCNLEINSYSESENGQEPSENSSSDILSSSAEVKLPSAGVDPISEDQDAKQFTINSTEVSSQNNPPESAVSSNECDVLPTQGYVTSIIFKESESEEKDEPILEAHTQCDGRNGVTLDDAVEKMDDVQCIGAELQPDGTNDMKDVQLERSTLLASILNIDGDASKCFPAEAAEVKSLEEHKKSIPVAQDFLCTQPPNEVIGKQSNATMLPSTSNNHSSLNKSIEVASNFGEDDQCTQAYVSVSTNEVTVERVVSKTVLTTDCSKSFESTELDDLCTQAYIKPIPNGRCSKQTAQSITASKLVRNIGIKSQNPLPPSSDQDILATQSYITAPHLSSGNTSIVSKTSRPYNREKSRTNTPVQKSLNGTTGKIEGGKSRKTNATAKSTAQESVVRDETAIRPAPRRSTRLSKRKSDQLRTEYNEEETTEAKLSTRSSRSTRTRSTNRPTSNNEGAGKNSENEATTSEKIKFEEKLSVPVKKNTRGRKKNTAASSKSKTISSPQASSCKETEKTTTAQKIKTESPDAEYVSRENGSGSGLATDMNSLDGQDSTLRIEPKTIHAETNLLDQSISSKSLKNRLKKEGYKKRRPDSVSSVSSSSSNVPKPPVRKKLKTEEDDDDFQNTTLSLRPRRTKPRVMFTGVTDAVGEAIVKELGGRMVEDISESTHLITDKIRRTIKFLCAVARGIIIVSPQWLHMSKEHERFLPEEEFELREDSLTPDSGNLQTKFKFQLHNSLETARSSTHYLFHGLSLFVTRNVIPPPDQMHQIIRCAGGEVLKKMPTAVISGTSPPVVIAADSDKRACLKAVKGGCYVVSNEFILTGILRQHLDFDSFALFGSGSANASSEVMKNKTIPGALSVNGAEEGPENNVDSLKENSTPNTSSSRSKATRTSKRKTHKKML